MKYMRKLLAPLVLHGPVRQWWILRQARRLDAAYLGELCRERDRAAQLLPDHPVATSGAPLRRILFIGDCMWEKNELFPELRKICNLDYLDIHPALTENPFAPAPEIVAKCIDEFIRSSNQFEPDVILFYARPQLLSDEAFELIRQRWKCPLLGMSLDDRVEFFDYGVYNTTALAYSHWAAKFDVNLTNARVALDWYRQRGATARYFPPGFHFEREYETPPNKPDYAHPFSFVGSAKAERRVLVEKLLNAGVPVTLFGNGWPNSAWVDRASCAFRNSQINLGIGFALPSERFTTTKNRDFECPGVGACYLTTYNYELSAFYEIGKEILCYRNFEELLEIHAYYIKRPEECLRIAQAAHRRCFSEHTWENRFRTLFRELGFKLNTGTG